MDCNQFYSTRNNANPVEFHNTNQKMNSVWFFPMAPCPKLQTSKIGNLQDNFKIGLEQAKKIHIPYNHHHWKYKYHHLHLLDLNRLNSNKIILFIQYFNTNNHFQSFSLNIYLLINKNAKHLSQFEYHQKIWNFFTSLFLTHKINQKVELNWWIKN